MKGEDEGAWSFSEEAWAGVRTTVILSEAVWAGVSEESQVTKNA